MRIKVLSLTIGALLSASVVLAQSKTTFGIRGGVNFYTLNIKNSEGDKSESKMTTGFNLGVNAEIPVGIDFFIQPGLLFTTKGGKAKDTDFKTTISYVEIPVNFIYKPDLGSGHVLLGFGPYIAFGVDGKLKGPGGSVDIEFKNELEPGDVPSYTLRRFDAGANFLVGYEWTNRFSAQLNAGLGLANISAKDPAVNDDESSVKNTGFGISLGYRFGK